MGDLISRAAAIEAALDGADEWDGGCNPTREEYIREHMAEVPAVDVPLRCKGCSFFAPHKHDRGEDSRCTMLNMEVRQNDYCSFGAWTN